MLIECRQLEHLHQWAKGRPVLVAVMAHQVAAGVPVVIGLCELIRSGTAARVVREQVGDLDWLAMYRQPATVRQVMQEIYWPDDNPSVMAQLGGFLTNRRVSISAARAHIDAAPPAMLAQVEGMFAHALRRTYVEQFQDLVKMVHNPDGFDIRPDVDMDEAMAKPAMRFAILVMLPALMEYGRSATWLYMSARHGNRQSLDKLLRVDKTVLGDPAIARHVRRFGMERDEFAAELVANAYAGNPNTSLERANVKTRLAAYLVRHSRSIGYKLRPVDVRRLFDALERDRTGNPHAIDTDLPEGEEAWRQAIARAKPFWELDLDRDRIGPLGRHGPFLLSVVVSDFDESETRPISLPLPKRQRQASAQASVGLVERLRAKLREWFVRLVAYAQRQ